MHIYKEPETFFIGEQDATVLYQIGFRFYAGERLSDHFAWLLELRKNMKLAILEYVVGGGLSGEAWSAIPTSLAREGRAMLAAMVADLLRADGRAVFCIDRRFENTFHQQLDYFSRRGRHLDDRTATRTFDDRLEALTVEPGELWRKRWLEASRRADATIVIAPESHGILADLVTWLRSQSTVVLLSDLEFLLSTSDKLRTAEAFQTHGVPHPATRTACELLNPNGGTRWSPLVDDPSGWTLKSRDGAGCEGMQYGTSLRELTDPIARTDGSQWIVQPWIEGMAASVVALCGDCTRVVLPCCTQSIRRSNVVQYVGGNAPSEIVSEARLRTFVDSVLAAIPGKPKGWIGIDWVYDAATDQCIAIEINPRFTTSLVGLSQLFDDSLVEACARIALAQPYQLARNKNRIKWSAEGELQRDEIE